jgi:hypothetical protein
MASIAVGIAKAVGLTKVNSSPEGFNQGMGYLGEYLLMTF